ncbi:5-keto-L-gluconate epimerase [Abditibacteriota bacterium]|nr:5-keto-L-gluconate epimerase [Abditibacteriota bacterium]
MKFGICTAPGALGDPARFLDVLADAGADYVEWSVGSLMASEGEFEKLCAVAENAPIKPEAFCVFLPPHHRITGPNVDLASVIEYASEAVRRIGKIGGEIVVLGSGGARKVPEGFPMDEARRQFEEFARELAPYAEQSGVTVAIEPLNTKEDNLITSVQLGAEITRAIDRPSIRLLADFYHMNEDGEGVQSIVDANGLLRHTHVADLGRVAPGFAREGEADFVAFFGALKSVGYDARCSFEGKTDDIARQAKPLLAHLRQRFQQA